MQFLKAANFTKLWYNGGNWIVFIVMWFIFSALMFAAEHTGADAMLEEEEMNKQDVEVVTRLISGQRELLTNDTELAGQMDRLLDIMQTSPMMPELFGKLNLEMALVKHDMVSVILGLFRDEFTRIKEELDSEDIEGKKLSEDLIDFFSDNRTVRAFSMAGEAQVAEYLETVSDHHHEDQEEGWDYGHAVHFTSTIFMNTGYGWRTPITTGGKILTIFIIIIQAPFYIHCLATLAAKINRKLDGIFNYTEFIDDEDLSEGRSRRKTDAPTSLKGCLVLGGLLLLLTAISAVYHYATDAINFGSFGDVLYFEFVRLSAVGFGDILPADEMTLAGTIIKNILINIPSQITLFTIFIRVLPLLS